MLKLVNGGARRAKPLVKTCLTSHAREIGEKKLGFAVEWRSSERLGKPITSCTYTTLHSISAGLHWEVERTDEPEKAWRSLAILLCSPRQSRRSGQFSTTLPAKLKNSPVVISKYGSAGQRRLAHPKGIESLAGANHRLVSRWPQSIDEHGLGLSVPQSR